MGSRSARNATSPSASAREPAPGLLGQPVERRGLDQALLEGATTSGFTGELWTLDRIALVIERQTEVRHHPDWEVAWPSPPARSGRAWGR
jgi:hypothetical protein